MALCGLLAVWVAAVAAAPSIIRVTPLVRDGQVLLTFEMQDAFSPEIRDAVQSGLNTTFAYNVELRRSTALWVDRTVDSAVIAASVRYDTLTRRYQMTRQLDGRVLETRVGNEQQHAQEWLTIVERLPVFSTRRLEPNTEYYLRVSATTRPTTNMFRFPWDAIAASATKKFTFLP
jgi:hypothetical protein